MTTTAWIRITLHDPVIASHDVATAAMAQSSDYLPGAMLWGVAVSKAYQADEQDILASYYGGGLIFDDALPG